MSYRNDRKRRHSVDRLDQSDHEWNGRDGSYDPLKVGSSDGLDDEPHDRGLIRALNSPLKPQRDFHSDPHKTLFIGRLHPNTTEDTLKKYFARFGDIRSLYLIRDILTGDSRRYAFVEYRRSKDADRAYAEGHNIIIDGRRILVDREFGRTMKGWKPRRYGGGYGGHKESGQYRFGGRSDGPSGSRGSGGSGGGFRPFRSTYNPDNRFPSYRRDFNEPFRSRIHGPGGYGYRSSGSFRSRR